MSDTPRKLTIGLPKGSLEEPTIALMARAGYSISGAARSYKPQIDDDEIVVRMLRAQEIARYVEQGFLDCGITGKDWVAENNAQVETICEMLYSKATSTPVRWVLVVPEDSPFKTPEDLHGKRVATEAVGLTQRFFAARNIPVHIEFSWGATEVKVPDLVDAIVDITETGSSLRANKLRIIATLMESIPQFIASPLAWSDAWKRQKMERLSVLLQSALAAKDKVGVKLNIKKGHLAAVLACLPSLRQPTICPLAQDDWVAVETILDERVIRDLIPDLKNLGAEGIIEYPLNKVVY